jgi:hypothetical protein
MSGEWDAVVERGGVAATELIDQLRASETMAAKHGGAHAIELAGVADTAQEKLQSLTSIEMYYRAEDGSPKQLSIDRLLSLLRSRAITTETLVWAKGMDGWKKMEEARSEGGVFAKISALAERVGDKVKPVAMAAGGHLVSKQICHGAKMYGDATSSKMYGDIYKTFQRFDADSSGTLDVDEVKAFCGELNLHLSHAEAVEAVNEMDDDGDGLVQARLSSALCIRSLHVLQVG